MDQTMVRRLGAEFLGTFILVLGGCGTAVLAGKLFAPLVSGPAATPTVFATGVGLVGIALAFGLTVLGGVYAFGHISGGHFNPAVTIGLATAKRFPWKDAIPYIVTQVIGAVVAAGSLVAHRHQPERPDQGRAVGWRSRLERLRRSLAGPFNVTAGLVTEIIFTAIFVLVILGVTDRRAPQGFAALAIGLTLTMIHLATIPVTGTSVNPARSTGPALVALFGGETWPIEQLWLFWVAPLVGALVGGLTTASSADPHATRPRPLAPPKPDRSRPVATDDQRRRIAAVDALVRGSLRRFSCGLSFHIPPRRVATAHP